MADGFSTSGMKFYIGDAMTVPTGGVVTETDFNGLTWVEVDGWSNLGSFGDASQVNTTPLINRMRDLKTKGTRNAGSMENTFVWLAGDAGQAAMDAAQASASNFAFKIEGPDTGGTTPTLWMFAGLVTASNWSGGDANSDFSRSFPVEINTNVVEVAAT